MRHPQTLGMASLQMISGEAAPSHSCLQATISSDGVRRPQKIASNLGAFKSCTTPQLQKAFLPPSNSVSYQSLRAVSGVLGGGGGGGGDRLRGESIRTLMKRVTQSACLSIERLSL